MQPAANPERPYADDEIDLRQLVGVLWRQKTLIAAITVIGAGLGAGASMLSTKYVSEGLFLMPKVAIVTTPPPGTQPVEPQGVTLDAFKRYETALANAHSLDEFLARTDDTSGAPQIFLRRLAQSPHELGKSLQPEFAFTDKDAKAFGVKNPAADVLIGIRVKHVDATPTGGAPVLQLAEYVRDTVIRVDMDGVTLDQCTQFRNREQILRNAQIANDFAIRQEQQRATTLRDLIARSPEATTNDSRQIVSLEKGSERFLSPTAQLVASEIQIADMKLAEVRRERDRIASALKRDYYCQAQQALQQASTGKEFLGELSGIQTAVFQNQDKSIDIVEQTWNELDVERANWTTTYLSGMRFVAPPEGTEIMERKPGLKLGIVLGGLVGGMFGVLVALVRAWWKDDKHAE